MSGMIFSNPWKFRVRIAAFVAMQFACAMIARAHNPDTSYARIRLGSDEVETRLTYDIFTLQKITDLDANRDQRVTRDELKAAATVIEKFLRAHVAMEINTNAAGLGEMDAPRFPQDAGDAIEAKEWHTQNGLIYFTFHKPVLEMPQDVSITFDFFDQFGERHAVLGTFEKGGQTTEVSFNRAEPDYLFDTGFVPSHSSRLLKFLKLGVHHIFLGYDHICFLVALIVVSRFKELIKIVTSFTVAHTVTLMLAAMQIVTLPTRLIESGIALTIVYVAAQNFWLKPDAHRWKLTFAFGLIHGFGFANVLRELGLPTSGTVRCLLSFNVGVELGQLVIVCVLLPVTAILGKWTHGGIAKRLVSVPIVLLGAGWFVERAFGIPCMPF